MSKMISSKKNFVVVICFLTLLTALPAHAQTKNPDIAKNITLGDDLFAKKQYAKAKEKYQIALNIDETCNSCQVKIAACDKAITNAQKATVRTVASPNLAKTKISVTIWPDADCTLYINGKNKGRVSANNSLKQDWAPGIYAIKAIGTNPADIYSEVDTINDDGSVAETRFIPLKAVIAKRTKQ